MGITIIAAAYGTPSNGNNVTGIVQQIVDKGHVSFKVDNTTMKGDPDYGATKYFGVVYKLPTGETWARACETTSVHGTGSKCVSVSTAIGSERGRCAPSAGPRDHAFHVCSTGASAV